MSDLLLIGDHNWRQFTQEAVGDQYGFGLVPRDYEAQPYGAIPFCGAFSRRLIPRSEWRERIRDKKRRGMRNRDRLNFFGYKTKNQRRTNYCWIFSTIMLMEMARLKMGQSHVPLSPASVAGPLTRYANAHGDPAGVGGWTTKAIADLARNGAVPSAMWPEHAIDPRYDTAATQAERAKYQADEWEDLPPNSFDAVATCLLDGDPVAAGLGWWGHLVVFTDLIEVGNGFGVEGLNPWGEDWPQFGAGGWFSLTEERATPNDAVCLRVVTAS